MLVFCCILHVMTRNDTLVVQRAELWKVAAALDAAFGSEGLGLVCVTGDEAHPALPFAVLELKI